MEILEKFKAYVLQQKYAHVQEVRSQLILKAVFVIYKDNYSLLRVLQVKMGHFTMHSALLLLKKRGLSAVTTQTNHVFTTKWSMNLQLLWFINPDNRKWLTPIEGTISERLESKSLSTSSSDCGRGFQKFSSHILRYCILVNWSIVLPLQNILIANEKRT